MFTGPQSTYRRTVDYFYGLNQCTGKKIQEDVL